MAIDETRKMWVTSKESSKHIDQIEELDERVGPGSNPEKEESLIATSSSVSALGRHLS